MAIIADEPTLIDDAIELYRRAGMLIRAIPIILLIPFAAELAQHAIEIGFGSAAPHGVTGDADQARRQAAGALKSLIALVTLLFALRWWRFDGDSAKAAKPDLRLLRGIVTALLVELGGSTLLQLVGFTLARAGHVGIGSVAWMIATMGPILLWTIVSVLLFPWYVALVSDDRSMGYRRSIEATYPIWSAAFGIYVVGIMPLMLVHYALGYGAMGLAGPGLWLTLSLDAGIVALMAIVGASTYYSIYLRARS